MVARKVRCECDLHARTGSGPHRTIELPHRGVTIGVTSCTMIVDLRISWTKLQSHEPHVETTLNIHWLIDWRTRFRNILNLTREFVWDWFSHRVWIRSSMIDDKILLIIYIYNSRKKKKWNLSQQTLLSFVLRIADKKFNKVLPLWTKFIRNTRRGG